MKLPGKAVCDRCVFLCFYIPVPLVSCGEELNKNLFLFNQGLIYVDDDCSYL